MEPEALRAYVKKATVDMERLRGNAEALEGLLRGKLDDFAAILTDPNLSPDPESSLHGEVMIDRPDSFFLSFFLCLGCANARMNYQTSLCTD